VISPLAVPVALVAVLIVAGVVEYSLHRRSLARIGVRIHVNGSRGKSSVVRLVAAGLRAGGIPTVAKTTGSAPRYIRADGSEIPIRRWGPANIREQIGIVRRAAREEARAIVLECMAIRPELGRVSERRMIRSTLGVITNVRPDHLDVMGPSIADVADALAGTVPRGGDLFVTAGDFDGRFARRARRRRCTFHAVEGDAATDAELAGFRYIEHPENVSLALAVCGHLGVERSRALAGMHAADPDPGALNRFLVRFFDKELEFVNAFAANDPESTLAIWRRLGLAASADRPVLALVHLRRERAHRGAQMARLVAGPLPADHVILVGEATDLVEKQALGFGLAREKLLNLGAAEPEEVFERTFQLTPRRSVVVGIGNLVGRGERIVRYYENRRVVP
jgi:poly-gamma-glutamate synthase PgsB/CapB